jgi:mxaJ protein
MKPGSLISRALCLGTALALLSLGQQPAPAQAQTQPLRVCEDPNYMPYSNRAGDGFENKIAQVIGHALGRPVEYYWESQRDVDEFGQYVHQTIEAGKCDLLVDVPYGVPQVDTTRPYFISSYVFVYKKSAGYDITSLDSPDLRRLKLGYEADTPVEDGLKLRTLIIGAKPFLTADNPDVSPGELVGAVESGRINVGLTWDPAVGYFLKSHPDLVVAVIPNSRSQGSPEQYSFPMAMATRENDKALNAQVTRAISSHIAQINAILHQYNIHFETPDGGGS